MAATYRTRNGDMIDLICHKAYGSTDRRVVERVLDANYGLADYPPMLPAGVIITLPDPPQQSQPQPLVKLWD